MTDYTKDFQAFYRDMVAVEGAYGPQPVIPAFLEKWLALAFPKPGGNPAARNIADFRTKKEGKSTNAAGVGLYMATRQPYAEVVIVAADKDQAKDRVLRACKYAVEHGPLASHAKVYKDIIELDNNSTIQAIPADWQSAAGGNFYCVIFDELHAWTYENQRRLFDEMIIPPTQPHGVRWIASYAGWDGESLLLKEWWDKALAGNPVTDNLPIFHNQAASFLAFVDVGPESWRMPWMNDQYISEVRSSERPNTFRRLWLNEWVTNESQFLPEGVWDACYSREVKPISLKDRCRLVLGADASTSRDLTALVGCAWNDATQTVDVVYTRIWKPVRIAGIRFGKPTIDLDETIKAEILTLHNSGLVDSVVYDPYQLHSIAIDLQKNGIPMIELPQTAGRIEADQALYDAIISKAIRHYNDPTLNEHISNAVAVETPRGFRLAKEKTSRKIDAAVALSMAHYGALNNKTSKAEMIANPFDPDIWPPPEGWKYDTVHGWHEPYSARPHPPGVTWHNCPRRNKGCEACEKELEAEGWFDQGERTTPMSEQEFESQWHALHDPYHPPPTREEQQAELSRQMFWRNVKRKGKTG